MRGITEEYIIVFLHSRSDIGNLIFSGEINLFNIKNEIKEEFGHPPSKTIILNIIPLTSKAESQSGDKNE